MVDHSESKPETISRLIEALNNESDSTREEAISSLKWLVNSAIEPLLNSLNSFGQNVRWRQKAAIAEILGASSDARAIEPLNNLLISALLERETLIEEREGLAKRIKESKLGSKDYIELNRHHIHALAERSSVIIESIPKIYFALQKLVNEQGREINLKPEQIQQIEECIPKPKSGGCFIVTAACGTYHSPEVVFLQCFRDQFLQNSRFGRIFISVYEFLSPPLAWLISQSEALKKIVRKLIVRPLVKKIDQVIRAKDLDDSKIIK